MTASTALNEKLPKSASVSLPSSPMDNSSTMLNNILANDENLTQSLTSHINSLVRQNIQFNWKNIWDYFYQAVSSLFTFLSFICCTDFFWLLFLKVESKIIKDIVNTNSHCFAAESNCVSSSFVFNNEIKRLNSYSSEVTGDSYNEKQATSSDFGDSNSKAPASNVTSNAKLNSNTSMSDSVVLNTELNSLKKGSQSHSVTPNSHYLQSMIVNTFNTPKYNVTSTNYLCSKLDTDIGSASCKWRIYQT